MVFGNIVAADSILKELLFGNLSDASNLLARKDSYVTTRVKKLLEEAFDTVRTREGEKVEVWTNNEEA